MRFSRLKMMQSISGPKIGDEDRKQVELDVVEEIYPMQFVVGCVILLFQAFMIVASLMHGGLSERPRNQIYMGMYVSLLVMTSFFVVGAWWMRRNQPENTRWRLRFTTVYACIIICWSAGITLLDMHSGSGLSVFCYTMLSLGAFIVLKPLQSVLVYGGGCALMIALVLIFWDNPLFFKEDPNFFGISINSVFIAVLTIVISITLYRSRMTGRYNRLVIRKQYEEIQQFNMQLNKVAMTDQLTQLGNRRYLEEKMNKLVNGDTPENRPVVGMMVDIDRFKQYNDSKGHQAGDQCLRDLAAVLMEFAENEHAFAVRYGGEEFFVCICGCSGDLAVEKAEALRKKVEARQLLRNDVQEGHVTISIGVDAEENWAGLGIDEFLRRCDEALYRAKNSGRNRVVKY